MPGPAKPGAAPGPVDPKLAALIARPVSVVEAEPEAAKRQSTAFDPSAMPGGRVAQAGQPARQPERGRKPDAYTAAAQAAVKEATGPQRIVRDGDVECPNCHQGNYPWRTFCRACGIELDKVNKASERHGLWGWIWHTMSNPVHARRQKVVKAGSRPGHRYRQSEGAQRRALQDRRHRPKIQLPHFDRKRFKKIMPFVLIALVLFLTFGPYKKGFRHDYENVKNWVSGLAPQFVQLYPVQTTASNFIPADPPGNVDDGDTTTFWASNTRVPIVVRVPVTKTVVEVGPGGGKHKVIKHTFFLKHTLSAPGVGQWVKLTYDSNQTFRAVSIIPGDQFPPAEFTKFGHPDQVELIFAKGAPIFFTVPNAPAFFQKTFFPPRTSNFIELKVLSTYAVPGKGQYDAITEFTAFEETG